MVQFYANYGELKKVEEKIGVSVEDIQNWLDGGMISKEHYKALSKSMEGK